jgi:hypothetical protein
MVKFQTYKYLTQHYQLQKQKLGSPIRTLANIPQSSNLKAWYKLDATATFDSSTGNWTIPDDSTNSNTGTSSGMSQANLVQSDLQTVAPYSKYAMNLIVNML